MVVKLVKEKIDVQAACRVLSVSRSGFYAWLKRPASQREIENRELVEQMKKIHQQSRETYGAPRITKALNTDGKPCGHNRVARLMKKAGIFGVARKRFRVRTTDSNHDLPIAPRHFQVEQEKTFPTRAHEVWVGDITYIPTDEGWLYLAIQLDIFTRKVVGYAMSDHLRSEAVTQALQMALDSEDRDPQLRLISHSDRGVQYASRDYRQKLKSEGITASMSRRGNCYDNAYAESFFHTLKVELVHRRRFKTRQEAAHAIFEYIEVWYNRRRLHSSLGYLSPVDYEAKALAA
jgi:putative transposase